MANQYEADPRQSLFLANYLDPKSATFSNAYQSAIKAGYEDEYAKVILNKDLDWLSESVKDMDLLNKAEKRLKQILDFEPVDDEGRIDNALLSNQMKAVTLIAKGLGKDKYSERVEQTGKGGQPLTIQVVSFKDESEDTV
jgi:phage terminase small subunit